VKLAPAGITVRELIDEFCGGMADGPHLSRLSAGRRVGRHPAGVDGRHSARFRHAGKYGCFIGSAAVVVLSDQDDMKAAALNLMRFFEDESCGQCTPCRVGTQKAALLMKSRSGTRSC
jgi:NADH:ubiquinone oxidoreductase subunit F (NADH-binding)